MKKIALKNNLEKFVLVDDEDYNVLNSYVWSCEKHKAGFNYAMTYLVKEGKRLRVYMHRMLLNPKKGEIVDHINHDGLDNSRGNLRLCDYSLNGINRKLSKDTQSKGVIYCKRLSKWRVTAALNKKNIGLGYYSDRLEAMKVYDTFVLIVYKEFAFTNILKEPDDKYIDMCMKVIKLGRKERDNSIYPRGEKSTSAKVTELQVLEIKKLYKTGKYSQTKLGEMFSLSQTHIGRLVRGERWTYLVGLSSQ